MLLGARAQILDLREHVRALLAATAAGTPSPAAAVAELNRISRAAPTSLELDRDGTVHERISRERGRPAARRLRALGDADRRGRKRACASAPPPRAGCSSGPGGAISLQRHTRRAELIATRTEAAARSSSGLRAGRADRRIPSVAGGRLAVQGTFRCPLTTYR